MKNVASYSDIRSALTQSIITLNTNTLGELPIAHDGFGSNGLAFNPDPYDLYLSTFTLYGERISLSKDSLDEILGVYQVTVKQKTGLSIKAVNDAVDSILANYRHNDAFIYNGQKVVIINSTRNGGRTLDGWYTIDVSINFKSDDPRS